MSETLETLSANAPELVHMAQLARALPAIVRRVPTLQKVFGFSGKEIAARLGIPDEAVEELLTQAARGVCEGKHHRRSALGEALPHLKTQVANRSR